MKGIVGMLVVLLGGGAGAAVEAADGATAAATAGAATMAPLPGAARQAVAGVAVSCLVDAAPGWSCSIAKLEADNTLANGIETPEGGMLLNVPRPDATAWVFAWLADGTPLEVAASYTQSQLAGDRVIKTAYGAVLPLPAGASAIEVAVVAGALGPERRVQARAFAACAIARSLGTRQRLDLVELVSALGAADGAGFLDWLKLAAGAEDAPTRVAAATTVYAFTKGAHPEDLDGIAAADDTALPLARRAGALEPPPPKARDWIMHALARDDLDEDAQTELLHGLRRVAASDAGQLGLDWVAHGTLPRSALAAEVLSEGTPLAGLDAAVAARLAQDDGTQVPQAASDDEDARDSALGRLLSVQERIAPATAASTAAEWLLHPASWSRRGQAVACLDRLHRLDAAQLGTLCRLLAAVGGDVPGTQVDTIESLFKRVGGADAAAQRQIARSWILGTAPLACVADAAELLATGGARDAAVAAALPTRLNALADGASQAGAGAGDSAGRCLDALAAMDAAAARTTMLAWLKGGAPPLAALAAERLAKAAQKAPDGDAAAALAPRLLDLAADDEHYGELLGDLRSLDHATFTASVLALLGGSDAARQEQAATCWAAGGDHDGAVTDALVALLPAGELDDHKRALLDQLKRIDPARATALTADRKW